MVEVERVVLVQVLVKLDLRELLLSSINVGSSKSKNTLINLIKNSTTDIVGVEIGVWEGENLKRLAIECPNIKKIYGIDPYQPYGNWKRFVDIDSLEPAKKQAQDNVSNLDNVELIIKTSLEASDSFEDESLDFVFIDGNHSFESVYNDIVTWYPKVKIGGLFSGDDFSIDGVNDALFKFKRENNMMHEIHISENIWYWYKH
jgi:hypothetical protein